MATVWISSGAYSRLSHLIESRDLPRDTALRVRERLRTLEMFPESGVLVERGSWAGFRSILGPWNWFLCVYDYDSEADTVRVATFEDSRERETVRSS